MRQNHQHPGFPKDTDLPAPDPEIQTLGEEIANSVTHGVGAALSVAALVLLVVFAAKHGDAWRVVSFSIFVLGGSAAHFFGLLLHLTAVGQ